MEALLCGAIIGIETPQDCSQAGKTIILLAGTMQAEHSGVVKGIKPFDSNKCSEGCVHVRSLQVSVRILGGLMALGYEIGTMLKRSSEVYADETVTVKLDDIEGMDRQYVQIQGKDRAAVAEVGRRLGLEDTYIARSYIEQVSARLARAIRQEAVRRLLFRRPLSSQSIPPSPFSAIPERLSKVCCSQSCSPAFRRFPSIW